jgi:hypothetical protein
MARSTMDLAQQNTERPVQATNWMRAIAEQNLNQSKAANRSFREEIYRARVFSRLDSIT